MFKWLRNKFVKPGTFADALKSVKAKFNLGEMVEAAPGCRVFNVKGSKDLIEISANGCGGFNITPLFESSMPYSEYVTKVGSSGGYFADSYKRGNHFFRNKRYPKIGKITEERFVNKFGPGGLSREYNYGGKSYFLPHITCI